MEKIVVQCDECGKSVSVPNMPGERFKCRCGAVNRIPDATPPDVTSPRPTSVTDKPVRFNDLRFLGWIVCIIGLLSVLLAVTTFAVQIASGHVPESDFAKTVQLVYVATLFEGGVMLLLIGKAAHALAHIAERS